VIRLIKRYPNRKLYDTVARRYVALRDVARLVSQGIEVRVVEHATDRDITARTLSQVILKQQRSGDSPIPHNLLARLLRASERSAQMMRRSFSTSWGILRALDEEWQERVNSLVASGVLPEAASERVRALFDELMGDAWIVEAMQLEEVLPQFWSRLNLASRQDVQELAARIDDLARRIESLRENGGGLGDQSEKNRSNV
jgi:polyhydroxyalkanoate synthesis repressor PhaR